MINIFPLSEGEFSIGRDKVFIPYPLATEDLQHSIKESLLIEIQPFLIQLNNELILLDTGLGFHLPNGELQLHHNIKKCGFQPDQISKVIISHLHKDHAGGIVSLKNNSQWLSFINASYYVSKQEFIYSIQNGTPSYVPQSLAILQNSNQVIWLDESGTISENISYEMSGGHCPHHIVIKIMDDRAIYFFGGDVAPQLNQLKYRYTAKYDYDGKRSSKLRKQYAVQGKNENWTFLFYHDIKTPTSKL